MNSNNNSNNNYSDILRLRSHEYYSSLLSFNNNNSNSNTNNSNQLRQQSDDSRRQPTTRATTETSMHSSFGPIFRSNSSLSLDQKRVQTYNTNTNHNSNTNSSHNSNFNSNCFSISNSNSDSIDFKDFQELRECRFGSDRTTTATTPTTTSKSVSSVSGPTSPTTTSNASSKCRTVGGNTTQIGGQSVHALSISNENLSKVSKIEKQLKKSSKTKSLFFSSRDKSRHNNQNQTHETSGDVTNSCGGAGSSGSLVSEELERRRLLRQLFIHYDIQSALSLDELFDDRKTTVTTATTPTNSGASGAVVTDNAQTSSLSTSNSSESLLNNNTNNNNNNNIDDSDDSPEEDLFENEFNSNSLLSFSPNFRNEIGKELIYCLQLNRENSENEGQQGLVGQSANQSASGRRERRRRQPIHTPTLSRQLSCLSSFDMSSDSLQSSLLSHTSSSVLCPFSRDFDFETNNCLETDFGFNYYRKYFYGFSHQNWFQMFNSTETGIKTTIALSLRKDSKDLKKFRVILRTNHSLKSLKGFLNLNHVIITGSPNRNGNKTSNNEMNLKKVFEILFPKKWTKNPEFLQQFKLGFDSRSDELLLKFDELLENNFYKIGVLYARDSQSTEEDFYNNKEILDKDFDHFLSLIGTRVRLKGYKGFRGGLDVTTDTTGLYAFATQHENNEIIYHVMNELPFSPNNRQQLLRKRHIGNDIVTIVFQSKHFRGKPFNPTAIRSHFQHVFIVVRPHHNGYRVSVARQRDVPPFGPPIKPFYRRQELRDFLLTKVINAENACHKCAKFRQMALRTRFEYLNDLYLNYTTGTTIAAQMSSTGALLSSSASSGTTSSSSTQQLIQFSQNFNKYFQQIFPSKPSKTKSNDKSNDNKNEKTSSTKHQKLIGQLSDKSSSRSDLMSSSDVVFGANNNNNNESKNIFLENELFFGAKLYESKVDAIDDTLGVVGDDTARRQPTSTSTPIRTRLMCHSFQQSLDIKRVKLLLNQNFLLVLNSKKVLFSLNLEQIIGFLLTNCDSNRNRETKRVLNRNTIEIQFKIYFHFGELLLLKEFIELQPTTAQDDTSTTATTSATSTLVMDSESIDAIIEKNSILFELKSDLMTKIRDLTTTSGRQATTHPATHRTTTPGDAMRCRQMKEIVLRRNPKSIDSSFGFHVQSKPLNNCLENLCVFVTEVNEHALRVNELRRGQRLLELCQMPLIRLTYDQILDFLKTSQTVSVALVQPFTDSNPRINGCFSHLCQKSTNFGKNQTFFGKNQLKKDLRQSLENLSLKQMQNQNQNTNYGNDYENIQSVVSVASAAVRHDSPVAAQLYQATATAHNDSPSPHLSSAFGAHYHNPRAQHMTTHLTTHTSTTATHTTQPTTPQTTTSHSQQRPLHLKANQTSIHALTGATNVGSSQSSTTSSTLQEDLIKLITLNDIEDDADDSHVQNDDNNDDTEPQTHESSNPTDSHSSSRYSTATSTPYSSLERRSTTGQTTTSGDDCVVTVAKPAYVVNEFAFGRQRRSDDTLGSTASPVLSSTTTTDMLAIEDIDGTEDDDELQWPSVVVAHNARALNPTAAALVATSVGSGGDTNPDFHLKLKVKELSKEKLRLNETIRALKEENQRLHFESQTASQQLRKFTEWFFSSNQN